MCNAEMTRPDPTRPADHKQNAKITIKTKNKFPEFSTRPKNLDPVRPAPTKLAGRPDMLTSLV